MEHTPTPWTVDSTGLHVFRGRDLIAGCGGHQDNFTPDLPAINAANAAFIVEACNAHDELVADNKALRDALEAMYYTLANHGHIDMAGPAFALARDALAGGTVQGKNPELFLSDLKVTP